MGFPGEHPINVRTGQMKRHILGSPGEVIDFKSGAYAWRWPHGTSSTSGSLRDKLKVAQRGGGSAGTAPPRPVIGLTGNDVLNITSSLAANVIAPGSYIVPGASFS